MLEKFKTFLKDYKLGIVVGLVMVAIAVLSILLFHNMLKSF